MSDTKEVFQELAESLVGTWTGRGHSKYPTIKATDYDEVWTFEKDKDVPILHFVQKTTYANSNPSQHGKTLFWDTGFILVKDRDIMLTSSQLGGRQETYFLQKNNSKKQWVFECDRFGNDPRMVKSQRILTINDDTTLTYELNMETKENGRFENHLRNSLSRRN